MDSLRVNALGAAALNALRPPEAVPKVQGGILPPRAEAQGTVAVRPAPDLVQGLAQALFQRSIPTALLFPVTEPAAARTDLMPGFTGSLLAALSAPRAATDATTPARATETTPTVPTVPQSATPGELPAVQDAIATSSSLDFALQTALRFGAGVAPLAGPPVPNPDLATGLVRDAAAIPRLGNLQPHTGAPGPEAFAPPGPSIHRILREYQTIPTAQGSPGLDLMG